MTDFDRWFEAQFGKVPFRTTKEEVASLRGELEMAQAELVAIQSWEASRRAALYAWTASRRLNKGVVK